MQAINKFFHNVKHDLAVITHPTITESKPVHDMRMKSLALRIGGVAAIAGGAVAVTIGVASIFAFAPISAVGWLTVGVAAIVFGHDLIKMGSNMRHNMIAVITRHNNQRASRLYEARVEAAYRNAPVSTPSASLQVAPAHIPDAVPADFADVCTHDELVRLAMGHATEEQIVEYAARMAACDQVRANDVEGLRSLARDAAVAATNQARARNVAACNAATAAARQAAVAAVPRPVSKPVPATKSLKEGTWAVLPASHLYQKLLGEIEIYKAAKRAASAAA